MSVQSFESLEMCFQAFKAQMRRNSDALFFFAHWYLVRNGFVCTVDGRKTEILPQDWNSNDELYLVNYSLNSKGFELKALVVDDSLVINLLKKSTERTASVTCIVSNYVTNHQNDFQHVFVNLGDLYETIDKEFKLLFKEEKTTEPNVAQSEPARRAPPSSSNDPLRVGEPRYPPRRPDDYGRADLDPFHFDPLRSGGGGMIFDPFRPDRHHPDVPGNLPRGAVPPGARFDPFGPPDPDNLMRDPSRVGPNPNHMRPPRFDDNMFM